MITPQLESEVRRLFENHFLFSQLTQENLAILIQQLDFVSFKMGQVILKEGESGNAAYLIYSGKVRILKTGPEGKSMTLATLSAGEFLGEHALLQQQPRSATVRAAEASVLFKIRREVFHKLLEDNPQLRPWFERLIQNRALARFLQTASFLRVLRAKELARLLNQFEMKTFSEGETIVREGNPGDYLYVLTDGEAKVTKGKGNAGTVLAYLGPGDYFGERALLKDEPRYASVIALSRIECAALSREKFAQLVASTPQLQEKLEERLKQYTVREEVAKRFGIRQPPTESAPAIPWESLEDTEITPSSVVRMQGRRSWFGLKKNYPFIAQQDESDCGAASLAMIARYHNVRLSVERLRDIAYVDSDGASGLSLLQAAEKIGYQCRAVSTDYGHLSNLALPAIAHWKGYHYLVLYEAKGDWVVLGDPAEGLVKMRRADFEEGWTGGLFLLTPTSRLGEIAPSRSARQYLATIIRSIRGGVIFLLVLSLFLSVLLLGIPFALQYLVDDVFAKENSINISWYQGIGIVWGLMIIVIHLWRKRVLRNVLDEVNRKTHPPHLQRLLFYPLAFFQHRQMGALLSLLNSINYLRSSNILSLCLRLFDLCLPLVAMAIIGFFCIPVFFLFLGGLALFICIFALLTPRFYRKYQEVELTENSQTSNQIQLLQKITAIKQMNAEPAEIRKLKTSMEEIVIAQNALEKSSQFLLMITSLLFLILIVLSFSFIYLGREQLTSGQLLALIGLLVLVTVPVFKFISSWPGLVRGISDLQHVADIQDLLPEQSQRSVSTLSPWRGLLQLERVGFRYRPEGRGVLTDINLRFAPGQFVWIVGRSGAGKTTLTKLLHRFHEPNSGVIKIDGIDLSKASLGQIRQQIHIVPEQPTLVAGTIRDNIALANLDATYEQVLNAAKLVDMHEVIMRFPQGYETTLSAQGGQLSTSQQQCLCIARALLADPCVLVLDGATAVLDSETEAEVLQNLRWYSTGRTTLILTRRLPQVQPEDTVVVLEEGQIVEKGKHQELLKQKGLYCYLLSKDVNV